MAFKKKADTGGGEQFKFESVGNSITGFYLGSHDHEGDFGPTKKHLFKTEKGIKTVFGQTHLTQLLSGEEPGKLMRVTYSGTKKTGKGKPMKEYTLEIDEDQVLDASEVETPASNVDYDEPAEDDETPVDEVKTTPVHKPKAAANPATQAKIAALLNKTKSV